MQYSFQKRHHGFTRGFHSTQVFYLAIWLILRRIVSNTISGTINSLDRGIGACVLLVQSLFEQVEVEYATCGWLWYKKHCLQWYWNHLEELRSSVKTDQLQLMLPCPNGQRMVPDPRKASMILRQKRFGSFLRNGDTGNSLKMVHGLSYSLIKACMNSQSTITRE